METIRPAVTKKQFTSFQDYKNMILDVIKKNQAEAKELLNKLSESSYLKNNFDHFSDHTDITGAVSVNTIDNVHLKHFFDQWKKFFQEWDKMILRWPEYVVALDPNFRSKEKVKILAQSLREAQSVFSMLNFQELSQSDKLVYLAVLDYAKNATITLFNTLIIPEKNWIDLTQNMDYNKVRNELMHMMEVFVFAYYSCMILDEKTRTQSIQDASNYNLQSKLPLITDYLCKEMVSRRLARPEATHPLILLGSQAITAKNFPNTNTIVALPWWSTELGVLSKFMFNNFNKQQVDLHMLPVSFHSSKDQWDNKNDKVTYFKKMIKTIKVDNRNILILDDNSSTWKTLQFVYDLFAGSKIKSLAISVAEADVERTWIDRENNKKRPTVGNPEVYKQSIWVLPVSKSIAPKFDIKEIEETKRLWSFYKKKIDAKNTVSLITTTIKYQNVIDPTNDHITKNIDLEDKIARSREESENNSIVYFRWSFLSNFYPVQVVFDNVEYVSVEHAYQAQKYPENVFSQLTESQLTDINTQLKNRWHSVEIHANDGLKNVFANSAFTSGNIKIISSFLDKLGFSRKDWWEVKLNIMTDLLIQKYKDPELKKLLQSTWNKYLIEWNTWDDVYRWRSNGRWANYLWRSLMYIRDNL